MEGVSSDGGGSSASYPHPWTTRAPPIASDRHVSRKRGYDEQAREMERVSAEYLWLLCDMTLRINEQAAKPIQMNLRISPGKNVKLTLILDGISSILRRVRLRFQSTGIFDLLIHVFLSLFAGKQRTFCLPY